MQRREVNLNIIYQELKSLELSCTQADRAIIKQITSRLLELDKRLQSIFTQVFQNLSKEIKVVEDLTNKLNEQYRLLANELDGFGKYLVQHYPIKPNAADTTTKAKLNRIGVDFLALKKLIPTKDKIRRRLDSGQRLYGLAEVNGGVYMPIAQAILPTMGGSEENGVISESKGTCAGQVFSWGDQYVAHGVPQLPVVCNFEVLRNQRDFQAKQSQVVIPLFAFQSKNITDLDYKQVIKELHADIPYFVTIYRPGVGHAIGLYKHSSGSIALFDPNYGYLFFADTEAAGIQFASLMLNYHLNMGFKTFNLSQYHQKSKVIVSDPFPGRAQLEKQIVESFSEQGYAKLLKQFQADLDFVVNSTSEDVINAFRFYLQHINSRLTIDDSQELLKCVEALFRPATNYVPSHVLSERVFNQLKKIIGKETKDFASVNSTVSTVALQQTVSTLKNENVNKKSMDANLNAFMQHLVALERKLRMHAGQRSHEVLQADKKVQKRLINESRYYSAAAFKLRQKNIIDKMIAGYAGKIRFGIKEATAELREIFGKDLSIINDHKELLAAVDKLDAEVMVKAAGTTDLVKRIDQLLYIITLVEAEIDKGELFINGFHALKAQLVSEAAKKYLAQWREYLEELRYLELTNQDADHVLKTLEKFIAPKDLAEVEDYTKANFDDVVVDLKQRIFSLFTLNINADDMQRLNGLYQLFASSPLGPIMAEITRLRAYPSELTPSQSQVLDELYDEVLRVKSLIKGVVTPKQVEGSATGVIDSLMEEVRKLSPLNVKANGFINSTLPDFPSYLALADLPQQVPALLTMDGLDPTYIEKLKKAVERNHSAYKSNKISFRRWLNNFLSDIGLSIDPQIGYAGITPTAIQQAIRDKNASYVLERKAALVTVPAVPPVSTSSAAANSSNNNDGMDPPNKVLAEFLKEINDWKYFQDEEQFKDGLTHLYQQLKADIDAQQQKKYQSSTIMQSHSIHVAKWSIQLLQQLQDLNKEHLPADIFKREALNRIQTYEKKCISKPLSYRLAMSIGKVIVSMVGVALGVGLSVLAAASLTEVGPSVVLASALAWMLGSATLTESTAAIVGAAITAPIAVYKSGMASTLFRPRPNQHERAVSAVVHAARNQVLA